MVRVCLPTNVSVIMDMEAETVLCPAHQADGALRVDTRVLVIMGQRVIL